MFAIFFLRIYLFINNENCFVSLILSVCIWMVTVNQFLAVASQQNNQDKFLEEKLKRQFFFTDSVFGKPVWNFILQLVFCQ